MKNKCLILLAGAVLLSGCSQTTLHESSSQPSNLPYVYTYYQDDTVGFATATSCEEGVIQMDAPLTFDVYYGRTEESEHPEIYSDCEGCQFYMEEKLDWLYYNKSVGKEIEGIPITIENAGLFKLPNLMEEEYLLKKYSNFPSSNFVTVSLDLQQYHDYFYSAKGWYYHECEDDPDREVRELVDLDLETVILKVTFEVLAFKNGQNKEVLNTTLYWLDMIFENDILTLRLLRHVDNGW